MAMQTYGNPSFRGGGGNGLSSGGRYQGGGRFPNKSTINLPLSGNFCRNYHNSGKCVFKDWGNCRYNHLCPSSKCQGEHPAFSCMLRFRK